MTAKKKMSRRTRILLTVAVTLVAVIAALVIAILSIPHAVINSNINQTSQLSESEVAVTPDLPPVREVHNIALFGVDQQGGHVGRSDAMIILSIDRVNNKIKMTSLSRDSLVPIDGHGEEKLTHAWAYGHAKLAVKTINQNYGMNITDYVYVNFAEFMEVIDYLGGVYVDVSAAEIETMNLNHVYLQELYSTDLPALSTPGVQLLNGGQTLLYVRNRTDGDTTRTSRHREVLTAMFERVKGQPLSKLPGTITKMLKLCHTNLTSSELLSIATWAITADPTIDSLHMPNDQLQPWNGILDGKGWVRVYDLDAATTLLHNFIYETDTAISGVSRYNPNTAKPIVTTTAATTTTTAATTTAATTSANTTTGTATTTGEATTSATEDAAATTASVTPSETTTLSDSTTATSASSSTDAATSTGETTKQTTSE